MKHLNPTNNKGFHKLPICLLEHPTLDLKLSAIVLYSVMLSRYTMFLGLGKDYCDSYENLSEVSKLSRATVADNLKELIKLGLVEVCETRKVSGTRFNKNFWKVKSVFDVQIKPTPSTISNDDIGNANVLLSELSDEVEDVDIPYFDQ